MKIRKRWRYLPYILGMSIGIALVIGFPLLLQIPEFSNMVSQFASGWEHAQYKEAYIGVWGGIIGSVLGVLGAVFVQGVADDHQQSVIVKQAATVVYYDMLRFNSLRLKTSIQLPPSKMTTEKPA